MKPPAHPCPLRVGIVGLVHGHADGFLHECLRRADIEIVGIAEPDEALAARYADRLRLNHSLLYPRIEDLLQHAQPAAILTFTSTADHRRVVETCALRGVHVMMEKPLAVSLADAQAIDRAAVAGKIHVLVNYETTWYPANRALANILKDSSFGPVRKIVAHAGHRGPKEIGCGPEFLRWLTDPRQSGAGALFDFGCYGADLATWLLHDQRPVSVTAVTQQIKPDVYPHVDDEATVVVTYPRAQLIIQASWNWPFDRKDTEVYALHGSVVTVGRGELRVRGPRDATDRLRTAEPIPAPENDPLTYLRAVVLDGLTPSGLSSLRTNMIVMEILDAARESARSGRTIQLSRQ